jgi:hypothetical protein
MRPWIASNLEKNSTQRRRESPIHGHRQHFDEQDRKKIKEITYDQERKVGTLKI